MELGVQVWETCHSECNEESVFTIIRFFTPFRMTLLPIDRIIVPFLLIL